MKICIIEIVTKKKALSVLIPTGSISNLVEILKKNRNMKHPPNFKSGGDGSDFSNEKSFQIWWSFSRLVVSEDTAGLFLEEAQSAMRENYTKGASAPFFYVKMTI